MRHNPGLDYPSATTIGRVYAPPAGEVWAIGTDEKTEYSDAQDAQRIEAWVVTLPHNLRRLLKISYLHMHPEWRCAQIMRLASEDWRAAHEDLLARAGQI